MIILYFIDEIVLINVKIKYFLKFNSQVYINKLLSLTRRQKKLLTLFLNTIIDYY